jgi:hypothetical protein
MSDTPYPDNMNPRDPELKEVLSGVARDAIEAAVGALEASQHLLNTRQTSTVVAIVYDPVYDEFESPISFCPESAVEMLHRDRATIIGFVDVTSTRKIVSAKQTGFIPQLLVRRYGLDQETPDSETHEE